MQMHSKNSLISDDVEHSATKYIQTLEVLGLLYAVMRSQIKAWVTQSWFIHSVLLQTEQN